MREDDPLPIPHSAPRDPAIAAEIPARIGAISASTTSVHGLSSAKAMNFFGPGTISASAHTPTVMTSEFCRDDFFEKAPEAFLSYAQSGKPAMTVRYWGADAHVNRYNIAVGCCAILIDIH